MLDLMEYAGHHLAASAPRFLEAVERIALGFPVKVDGTLYSAVVCAVRRLPAAEAAPAFRSVLASTVQQLLEMGGRVEERPGGRLALPESAHAHLFRLLTRTRSCVWTLEQTPEEPDGP